MVERVAPATVRLSLRSIPSRADPKVEDGMGPSFLGGQGSRVHGPTERSLL